MESLPFIQWCLDNLNYFTIALLMAIESSFIPFPSEVVVPPAAYGVAEGYNNMNIWLVVVSATFGAIIGSLINYGLALWLGRPVVYKFANSRLGHFFLITQAKVEYAEQFFARHGAIATFFGRLVPAVRQLISIPAGLARMSLRKFVLYTVLGAGIWNCILAALGYWLASIVTKQQLDATVSEYSVYIKWGGIALGVLLFAYLLYKAMTDEYETNEKK